MDAKQNLYDLQMERFEAFEKQDSVNGNFDVIFEIGEKKLYANKYFLCSISSTFESMLSDRWSKSEEPIAIKDYSFADFKEFLTFIYSGQCQLTIENINSMIDMSEFYGITVFKNVCVKFLLNVKMEIKNIFQLLDLANQYSIEQLKYFVNEFISNNLSDFFKLEQFKSLQKADLLEIVKLNQGFSRQEEIFEAVYKWAENQISKTNSTPNINDAMKKELSKFLPFFKFERMNYEFFVNFVARKGVFSYDELCDILLARKKKVYVRIIDRIGKKMEGELQSDEMDKVVAVIESLKTSIFVLDQCYKYFYWRAEQQFPSTPSKVIKNENVKWYLVYDHEGDLAVKDRESLTEKNYLLAELFAENGFNFSSHCKIEIYHFA